MCHASCVQVRVGEVKDREIQVEMERWGVVR